MATIFLPPAAPLRPAAVRRDHPGFALFRHYRPWDAGTNIWLTVEGVVTTDQPAGSDVLRTFHGGHVHEVDEAQAAALTAAGYGAYLSTVGDAAAPSPLPSGALPAWSNSLPDSFGF